jgi:multiple sugar transport system ATP-binding protein
MGEIVLEKVVKKYPDGALAVHELDLHIADGEFVILVGPSGCGKSTTLNMIAGLEDISSGQLRIDGEVVNQKAPKDRDIAMVFQNYALYPHMTVRENMAFPLTLAKVDKAEVRRRVDEAAELLELTEHLPRKPAKLSGGQRQRVAMGRAIVRSPKAFLMDEPLSNLDAKLRVQMRTEVSRLQQRLRTTMVYVTHDQTEAMTLGDRVVVLNRGVAQQVGTPQELYERPVNLFVAGFIGSPAMNFLPAELGEGVLRCALGDIPLPGAPATAHQGREVIVGLRPETFEAATLVDQTRSTGVTFTTTVELVESMGSDLYVHFTLPRGGIVSSALADAATGTSNVATAANTDQIVARLAPESRAQEGSELTLWLDASKVHVFDPETSERLAFDEESPAAGAAAAAAGEA